MKAFTKNSNSNGSTTKSQSSGEPFFGVQTKLAIGKADDPYERQADSMAEQVVSKKHKETTTNGDSFFGPKPSLASQISPGVQLKTVPATSPSAPINAQTMPFEDVQTMEAEEAPQTKVQLMPFEDVQAKFSNDSTVQLLRIGTPGPTPNLGNRINDRRGSGTPLPEQTRSDMESGYGADFSGVNVHTDTESAQMNDELGAQAFTSGNDIFFNQGQFNPNTQEGQTLLAHELTHTIQQGASTAVEAGEQQATEAGVAPETGPAAAAGQALETQAAATVDGEAPAEEQAVEGEVPTEEVKDPNAEVEGEAEGEAGGEGGEGEGDAHTTPRNPEDDPNFQQLEGRVDDTATGQQENVGGQAAAGSAQSAAVSPPNERDSMAQSGQVDAMDEAEPEEFSAEAFKAQLMERINSMQLPSNPDEADNFDDNNNIDEVNEAATQDANNASAAAAGPVQSTTAAEPNTDAVPEREVTPLPEPPVGEAPASVNPSAAMPPKRGKAEVNKPLQDNMSEVDQEMADNEITEEQLANSNEPKFMEGLEAKNKAKEHTETAPGQLRQQEQGILSNSQVTAEGQAREGLTAMHQDRTQAMNDVNAQQGTTGQTDTAERTRIAGEINTIYEKTKTDVEKILSDLDETVASKFTIGAASAKTRFENYVERKMDAYKDRRYSGLRGAARWLRDKFAGMPDEVNQFFVDGRQVYIDAMDVVITDIANIVATELKRAKDRVNEGKQEVQDYVTSLPENLQQIGSDAAEEISSKFDELEESVNSKQEELIDNLAEAYVAGLEAVDARIEEMKAANRGLIDMALGAIMGIIQTIIDIKNMLTELLVGAMNAIMTIISDPIGFLSNLFGGIKQGFEQFGSNILTHLQTALIQWLTGALGPVGITIPDDLFSLKGIFSLVAQILGLTWDYIRQKAVKHLGEPVVQALETGFEIFQIVRTQGIDGLWEYIKEQFNDLKETVIDAIKDMVISTVIEAGIKWVLGLLNPASAFVKACMMIIDVVRFFIERGSQIIELVRAFIEGVNAVASGNVTAVANAIENALARALPVIIGFLASLLGISGLARKVTKLIKKIRKRVDKAVEKLIKKAKKAFRKLVRKGKAKVKGAIAGLAEWWKKKKKFKNKGGENHTLSFKGVADKADLYIASTPVPLEQYLADQEANPSSDKAAVKTAKGILKNKVRIIIRGSKKAQSEKKEKQKMKDVGKALNDISVALQKLAGNPAKPKPAVYNSSGPKPTSVSVVKLHDGSKRSGSKPKTGKNSGTTGWYDIKEHNLSKISDKWVQMHIINMKFGGKGAPDNLVPGPNSVNKGAKQERFDKMVKNLLKDDKSVIWIDAGITYRSGAVKNPKDATKMIDLGQYVNTLTLEAGLHVPQGTNWDTKSPTKVKTSITIPKPDFKNAGKIKVKLNATTGTDMEASGIDVLSGKSWSSSLRSFIKRERTFNSWADFETKLTDFAESARSKVPESAVDDIMTDLRANKVTLN